MLQKLGLLSKVVRVLTAAIASSAMNRLTGTAINSCLFAGQNRYSNGLGRMGHVSGVRQMVHRC